MANVTVTMNPRGYNKELHSINGLHLLSAVAHEFLHENARNPPNTLTGLPLVSACSSPTEQTSKSKTTAHVTLQEKARMIRKSNNAIPIRAPRPKVFTYRIIKRKPLNVSSHPSVASCTATTRTSTTQEKNVNVEKPNLVLLSPTYHQDLSNHQRIQDLYLKRIEKKALIQGRLLCDPILSGNNKTSTQKPSTKSVANGANSVSKKSKAELNYIKHRAVPMRQKWMARFLELAAFKKKYGHTKVPHNFPDSPKLAEWQVRCMIHQLNARLVFLHPIHPCIFVLTFSFTSALQKFQRQQRKLFIKGKHSQLTPERVVMLEKIGFVWEARIDAWESHYQNLKRFEETNGHVHIPVANTVLSQWVKRQRKQYKKYKKGQESSLTKDRVDRLNKLGFIWDGRQDLTKWTDPSKR